MIFSSSHIVKKVPWINQVDLVQVDDNLRERAQREVDDRFFLSSASSDASEISLMTTERSEGKRNGTVNNVFNGFVCDRRCTGYS